MSAAESVEARVDGARAATDKKTIPVAKPTGSIWSLPFNIGAAEVAIAATFVGWAWALVHFVDLSRTEAVTSCALVALAATIMAPWIRGSADTLRWERRASFRDTVSSRVLVLLGLRVNLRDALSNADGLEFVVREVRGGFLAQPIGALRRNGRDIAMVRLDGATDQYGQMIVGCRSRVGGIWAKDQMTVAIERVHANPWGITLEGAGGRVAMSAQFHPHADHLAMLRLERFEGTPAGVSGKQTPIVDGVDRPAGADAEESSDGDSEVTTEAAAATGDPIREAFPPPKSSGESGSGPKRRPTEIVLGTLTYALLKGRDIDIDKFAKAKGVPKASVRRQLRALRDAGFVKTEVKDGGAIWRLANPIADKPGTGRRKEVA